MPRFRRAKSPANQSPTFPMTSPNLPSAISSLELPDGPTPSSWQDGQNLDLFGQPLCPAKVSAAQAKAEASRMLAANSGTHSLPSSASTDLTAFLASRLRRQLDSAGSTEYSLTWRQKATPAGRPYFALLASGHRTSGSEFSGWPTPVKEDCKTDGPRVMARMGTPEMKFCDQRLRNFATMAGWHTPDTAPDAPSKGTNCKNVIAGLGNQARSTGWPTPHTPRAHDSDNSRSTYRDKLISGRITNSSLAETENSAALNGALNAALARWLQGYPVAWCQAAIRASRKLTTRRKRG